MCGLKATVFWVTLFVLPVSNQASARSIQQSKQTTEPPAEFCGDCVEFSQLYLYQLINITHNYALNGGCTQLCGILGKESQSATAKKVCNNLCDAVGMDAFLSAMPQSKEDPIYFCVILKGCFAINNGDAKILSLNVTPSAIPEGGDYTITMILETIDGTGMGQISLLIKAESSVMKNKTYLMDPQFTNRTLKWVGKANMDPDCESNCKPWLPGKYILEMAVCYKQCDRQSQVYDSKTFSFTVVKKEQEVKEP